MPIDNDPLPDFVSREVLTAADLNTIVKALRRLGRDFADHYLIDEPDANHPAYVETWIGKTAASSTGYGAPGAGVYTVDLYFANGPAMAGTAPTFTKDGTFAKTVQALNLWEFGNTGTPALDMGTLVQVTGVYSRNQYGDVLYIINAVSPTATFAVDVTQTGGSAGNSTTYCSFTYTVKSVGGATTIGTAVAVTAGRARTVKCVCVAGTHGVAYYDNTGALKLWDVDETQTLKALDVVTGVMCNGDGTISVTTENVKVYGVDP